MSQRQQPYTAVIFDLGDVLFKWSPHNKTSISPQTIHSILKSPTWFDYECGRLTEADCYTTISSKFEVTTEEVRQAFQDARDSLQADQDLVGLIHELKTQSSGQIRVYAMSNISPPDWETLQGKHVDWSIFDQVFTSGAAGERKPNLGFYRHVINATGLQPHQTIFIDDKFENVFSARSLGFCGIVFDNTFTLKRALRNLIGDPIQRGRDFLLNNARKLESVARAKQDHETVVVQENFTQLLILEVTGDRELVNLVEHPRTWNFFQGKTQLSPKDFPFDLDTTSLGITVLKRDRVTADSVMNEMLEYVDTDGIIQTYFDHRRPRIDPVVCVNVLSLFYTYSRGSQLHQTLEWVHEVLLHRAYVDGTRYYESAEIFLYFIRRLLLLSSDPELHELLEPLLKERVQERIGVEGDPLALAMRIIVCDFVGIRDEVDLRTLLMLQCEDGGWEVGLVYRLPSSGIRVGNRGLATALAIKAVETILSQPVPGPSAGTSAACDGSLTSLLKGLLGAWNGSLRYLSQWLWNRGAKLGGTAGLEN